MHSHFNCSFINACILTNNIVGRFHWRRRSLFEMGPFKFSYETRKTVKPTLGEKQL